MTKREIEEARAARLKVYFTTYIRYADATLLEQKGYPSPESTAKLLSQLRSEMIDWARFLESENVEIFQPTQFLGKYVEPNESIKWFKDILPELRGHYSGKLVIPQERDPNTFYEYDYSGYDYLGLIILPVSIRSWDECKSLIQDRFEKASRISKRDNINILITMAGGILEDTREVWVPLQDDPGEIKKRVYQMVLEEASPRFARREIEGIFFYEWAFSMETHAWAEKRDSEWQMVDRYQGMKPVRLIESYFIQVPYRVEVQRLGEAERIWIDEEDDDWYLINPIMVDPPRDSMDWSQGKPAGNPGDDIKAVYAAVDDKNLYIMVDYYVEPSRKTIVKIDLDLDGSYEVNRDMRCNNKCGVAEISIPLSSLKGEKSIFI